MKKSLVLIAPLVVVVGLGAVVAVAKETTKVDTSVRLKFRYVSGPNPYWPFVAWAYKRTITKDNGDKAVCKLGVSRRAHFP